MTAMNSSSRGEPGYTASKHTRHSSIGGTVISAGAALGPQHLPRGYRQRLGQPELLALQRDGGGGGVVHGAEQAQDEGQQHRHGTGSFREGLRHQFQQLPALPQEEAGGQHQKYRAEAAVEHIVGAGGEAAQLPVQQGGGNAPAPDGLGPVDLAAHMAGGRGDGEEAAGEQQPRQAEQHGDGRRQKQHGQGIAGARLTEEVHGVGGGADLVAIEGDVLQQLR